MLDIDIKEQSVFHTRLNLLSKKVQNDRTRSIRLV